jgi:hypothetical protein
MFVTDQHMLQMQLPDPELPNLACVAATEQKVVHGLDFLVTEDTGVRLLQAMPKAPVSSLAPAMHYKPDCVQIPKFLRKNSCSSFVVI